jgi:DNA (cytosine-5)-methyltransferase 1
VTFGSLFAGIGGMDLGLERAGMECKFQVEIDPFCRRVLAKHWPDVRRYEDVRTIHGEAAHVADAMRGGREERPVSEGQGHEAISHALGGGATGAHGCDGCLPPVELLCGGFPCQPHSLAGRRRGSDDERDLWCEFARLIREVRPRWVLAENVPGLLSSEAGRFFGRVLRDLAACGYDAEWDCLPASAVGAPHRRDRVWIVAYPNIAGPQGWLRAGVPERADEWAAGAGGASLADADECGFYPQRIYGCGEAHEGRAWSATTGYRWWRVEPNVGRVAHGVSARVDRLRSLGNAVVPQVAEFIGRRILAADEAMRAA